jgi:prepilin-type N-terminal cleavage/methylation domain-containing protein
MKRHGFTLMEMLMIIAIIGILAARLLPVLSSFEMAREIFHEQNPNHIKSNP